MRLNRLGQQALWALVLCILLFPVQVFGQADKGTLPGTVADAARAPVPQVTVTIIEVNTGFTRSGLTNEAGNFSFPLLDPGTYRVEGQHQGFKKAIQDNVLLDANSSVRVDLILQLGAVTESVQVSANAAQ